MRLGSKIAIGLIASVWLAALITIGPKMLEWARGELNPPVSDVAFVEPTLGDGFVTFQLQGHKNTNDRLITLSAAWTFPDHTIMPAALAADNGDAPAAVRVAGEEFLSRIWHVDIAEAVRANVGVNLRVCFIYDRAGLFCTDEPFEAFVAPN